MAGPFSLRARAGSAAVEFALILPVLLLLLLGTLDFAWTFYQHGVLTRALREGCRDGAVVPATGDPIATATTAIEANLAAADFPCSGTACTPAVAVSTTAGHEVLSCTLQVPVVGLSGYIPAIDGLTLTTATRAPLESWSSP